MKVRSAALLATLLFASLSVYPGSSSSVGTAKLRLGTFNIKYTSPRQTKIVWKDRREAVVETIGSMDVDILAFQEMETFAGRHYNGENVQLEWLRDHFDQYAFAAQRDPATFPSTQPIMYREDRLTVLDDGFFFFSSTPDVIYSRPWYGSWPSFCSWVRFEDNQTGERFYVYNVHFDVVKRRNRGKSAELVAQRVQARQHAEDPAIVVGDTNSLRFMKPMRILRHAGLRHASARGSTFHMGRGWRLFPAIDHIMTTDNVAYRESRVVRARPGGTYPSDHHPVVSEICL